MLSFSEKHIVYADADADADALFDENVVLDPYDDGYDLQKDLIHHLIYYLF